MTARKAMTVTTINGQRVPPSQAKISVFDNALLYAEGLFETFLACDDRVIFLNEHLDRLYRGARVIDLVPPVKRDRLAQWMKSTVAAHPASIKKLRLTITSGEATKWVGVQGKPQVILSVAPHSIPAEPFRLQVSDFRVDQDSEFRRIKTISYAIHAAALKRAHQDGFDDALMINQNGHVAEITSANVFWRRGRTVYTPPLSAGCLEGVTRYIILQGAEKHGVKIVERTEPIDRMVASEEVFICSSLKLVLGVSEIVHKSRRYCFPTGEVTQRLGKWLRQVAGI